MKNSSITPFYFNHVILNSRKKRRERIRLTTEVIRSGIFFNGQQTKTLTQTLQKFLGSGYVTVCASGHDALSISLSSLNLKGDDEIIFPVNAYPTAFPVCLSKGKPVPVDVDENGQIDPEEIAKKINAKTKAIIVVHLYGLVGKIEQIKKIINRKNILIIEDCAQSFGTLYNDAPVGTIGDISCFSFYPTKNLATLGDGGALWTKNKELHKYFLKAKSYGEKKRYWSEFVSFHSRIPELQAGILNLYFRWMDEDLRKRRKLEIYYRKMIKALKLDAFFRALTSHPMSNPALHLFVVEAKKRNKLKEYLKSHSIPTLIHYPYPIHLLPAFSHLGYNKGDFPIAERLSKNIISLPFSPALSKKKIKHILKIVQKFYRD